MPNIFQEIISGKKASEKVFENEKILAIKDAFPVAPVHLLIMPKKIYASLQAIPKDELGIISEIVSVAQKLAEKFGVEEGYRLLTNIGPDAGQSIFHLHFHLIGGKALGGLG